MINIIEIQVIIDKMKSNNGMKRSTLKKNLDGTSIPEFKQIAKELGYNIYEQRHHKDAVKNGRKYEQTYYKYTAEKIKRKDEYACGIPTSVKICPVKNYNDDLCRICKIKKRKERTNQKAGHDHATDKLYGGIL